VIKTEVVVLALTVILFSLNHLKHTAIICKLALHNVVCISGVTKLLPIGSL